MQFKNESETKLVKNSNLNNFFFENYIGGVRSRLYKYKLLSSVNKIATQHNKKIYDAPRVERTQSVRMLKSRSISGICLCFKVAIMAISIFSISMF